MQKKWAIRWVLPAVMILLLHTFVPHGHGWMNVEMNVEQTTCQHQHHGVWEFFEHLLTQDCGIEHLENYQVSDVDSNKKSHLFNAIFSSNNFNYFYLLDFSKNINKIIPSNDFIFSENRFITEISFRGPPIF